MSIDRNFGRTLSGATDIAIDNLRLGNNVNSIRINGDSGLPNQGIFKNGTTGKLEWDFATGTTIPDNSIVNAKLKDKTIENDKIKDGTIIGSLIASDIGFSTTGTINANKLTADDIDLPKTGSANITLVGNTGTITCEDLNVNNHTGTIDFNEIKTDKLILPIDGTANCEILSNGNIITNGSITGGSIVGTSLASSTTISSTGNITSGGDITINGGNDLLVNSGGKVDLFSDNGTTRTIDIDGSTGDLKVYNPTNGNERIELDGSTGNVIINDGGRIDMFLGNTLNIELNGVNGVIDCNDINVLSHTGLITFDKLRCDIFNANSIQLPEDPAGGGGSDFFLTNNTMTFSNAYTINGDTSEATFKTLTLNGGSSSSLVVLGNVLTGTDASGNLGSITANTGDITATAGVVSGNSLTTAGNITATGTTGFVGVGTNADTYNIILNKDGEIECEDLTLNNHTGSITFNEIKTDKIELPKTGTADIILDGSTGDLTLTTGELEVVAGNSVFRGGADFLGDNSIDIADSSTTLQFRMNPSTGDFTATTGNITATAGTLRSNKVGSKPAPENSSSYTDWALSLSNNNSHAYIGGNLICDGTIYANIEGTITEEVVECQRLNIRTDPSGGATGNTEISFIDSNGLLTGYFDTTGTGTVYTNYSTPMKHMRLDSTNYKNSQYEIGVSIPNSSMRQRIFSTTSTSWTDLNDQLSIRIQSDGSQLSYYVVDFSFYAVITAGARLWLKLYDSALGIENTSQLPVYNNTMSQVLLDSNGGSDFAGVHNVRFLLYGIPKNHNNTVRVACWVITSGGHKVIFKSGGRVLGSNATNPSLTFDKYPAQVLQVHKVLNSSNISTNAPTGWSAPSGTLTESPIVGEKLMSYSYIDNDSQNFVRIYNTANKFIFNGSQDSGTDTLEVHFTATSSTGYLEFGFYANTLTAGMIFHCGVAVATGGTSPFSTTLTSSAVSIDGYKLGLFNGDTSRYSLKEILDFTSYENTFLTSKFHFNNLTVGTEYKMALYGRCNYSGSIYINTGGKSTTGTANRSAHQPAFLKFYEFDSNIGGARTDEEYVGNV